MINVSFRTYVRNLSLLLALVEMLRYCSNVIPSECEESHVSGALWRFFLPTVVRMTSHRKVLQRLSFRSVCEESYENVRLAGDSSFHFVPFRMTFLSSRTKVRDLMPYALLVGDSSLRFRCVQNDSCLLLLSHRKEVSKKGRPLVIGDSCLSLRSPTGLWNSLRSNSSRPLSAFSLAPGSPIKAGMPSIPFSEITDCQTSKW